jgi:PmbA protein
MSGAASKSQPARGEEGLEQLAARAVAYATARGAKEAAASARKSRSVSVQYRDGEIEQLRDALSAGLSISLYVDGRYSSHSTSDLRVDAVEAFIDHAIALTRLLGEDPHRGLADPALYENRPIDDLEAWDERYDALDPARRKALAAEAEAAARGADGPIISATGSYSDGRGESARVHSNGFSGTHRGTQFWVGAEVSVRDEGDRKPEDWHFAGARRLAGLPDAAEVGREAARRALSRLGQKKLPSGEMPMVLDGRVAGRLLGALLGAMSGAALQQKRSFLLDKQGQKVGSPLLTLVDDPLLPGGFASRHFDGDGISSRRRTLIEGGVLAEYLVDVYYGRKLGMAPTGGGTSNLILPPGDKDVAGLLRDVGRGVYVTGILGGNADGTSGDFSHGIVGFEIVDGKLGGPIGEMNVTGSHAHLWERLVAVGNDPYPYASYRLPTMVFDRIAVSGT